MPTRPPSYYYANATPVPSGKEVIIPAWNDIIHLARTPTYTARELGYMTGIGTQVDTFGRTIEYAAKFHGVSTREASDLLDMWHDYKAVGERQKELAMDMLKSPSPAISKDLGTIMTALDDVQDFTTTVGVISRMLGRVWKPFDALAVGAFTIGESLNKLNLMNRLTGGEISRLCRLLRNMRNSSHKSTIKGDVDKRMKRLFPSKGELFEIAQTSDQLFGVGISLGPIVGLVQDALFGAFSNAPVRFKEWKISDAEIRGIINAVGGVGSSIWDILGDTEGDVSLNESASNLVIGAEHLTASEYLTGLASSIQSGLAVRAKEVKNAVIDIFKIISGHKATPKKKTKTRTRLLLQSLGIDPYGPSGWPIDGLGPMATLHEIQAGYEAAANRGLQFWRDKLGVSDEGLFLDACVKEIGTHAMVMFCDDDGVITESLDPTLLVYINALESHLNPPADTSTEKFAEWNNWILDQMKYYDQSAPDLKLLQEAFHRFF